MNVKKLPITVSCTENLRKFSPEIFRRWMKIGWTLNVVIVEAALARDERKWYLEQALCRGWSKTQLLNAIRSGIDSTEHLEQFDSPEKQVDQVAVENPVFIVEVMRDIHTNDDFLKKSLVSSRESSSDAVFCSVSIRNAD